MGNSARGTRGTDHRVLWSVKATDDKTRSSVPRLHCKAVHLMTLAGNSSSPATHQEIQVQRLHALRRRARYTNRHECRDGMHECMRYVCHRPVATAGVVPASRLMHEPQGLKNFEIRLDLGEPRLV